MKILTLKNRSSFEFANKFAKKISTKGIVLQVFNDNQTELKEIKTKEALQPLFGFTATKKIGGAVIRNKCKRRMRAIVREIINKQPTLFKPEKNYIFIARFETTNRKFSDLVKDAKFALYNVDKVSDVPQASKVANVYSKS